MHAIANQQEKKVCFFMSAKHLSVNEEGRCGKYVTLEQSAYSEYHAYLKMSQRFIRYLFCDLRIRYVAVSMAIPQPLQMCTEG